MWASIIGSATETKAGWTAGGGVVAHISGPWSVKAEYLFVDLVRYVTGGIAVGDIKNSIAGTSCALV